MTLTEKEINDIVSDRIVEVMNRALEADPGAINALINHREPCSEMLAGDPAIQVLNEGGETSVGMVGILSGISGVRGGDGKRSMWSNVEAIHELMCPRHGPLLMHKYLSDPCGYDGCQLNVVGEVIRFQRAGKGS